MAGLSALLVASACLIAVLAEEPIAGLPPFEVAVLTGLAGVALAIAGAIVSDFRHSWAAGLRSILLWGLAYAVLIAAYGRQDVIVTAFDRLIGEVAAGRAVVSPGGEVVIARRADGTFTIDGRINGREARFIFDTGASAVVLTAEGARALNVEPNGLRYTVPVVTANGSSLTAPVLLDSLAIGPIVARNVRALVARPGVLRQNLLGMTFLERLESYEVRGSRLILRPRAS
jgi:aspartyl protease family protein